jgi:hypothetical protein
VPHYKLPRLHAELAARGVLSKAEMRQIPDTFGQIFAPRRTQPELIATR